jgi:hypothetical protein
VVAMSEEGKKYYLDDIDKMFSQLADKIPRATTEMIYLSELQTQMRIYLVLVAISILLFVFVLLL